MSDKKEWLGMETIALHRKPELDDEVLDGVFGHVSHVSDLGTRVEVNFGRTIVTYAAHELEWYSRLAVWSPIR